MASHHSFIVERSASETGRVATRLQVSSCLQILTCTYACREPVIAYAYAGREIMRETTEACAGSGPGWAVPWPITLPGEAGRPHRAVTRQAWQDFALRLVYAPYDRRLEVLHHIVDGATHLRMDDGAIHHQR